MTEKQDGPAPAAPVARRFRRRRRANATPDAARSVEQKVRLTPGELEQLRARAGEAGVSVPRLLVESAFGGGSGAAELRAMGLQLIAAHTDISRAAGNMNQVARKANTTHEVPSAFGPAIAELRGCAEVMVSATEAIAAHLNGGASGTGHDPVDGVDAEDEGFVAG